MRMRTMYRRVAAIIAVLAVAASIPALATAKSHHGKKPKPTAHSINWQATTNAVSKTGSPPAAGSTQTSAGVLSGSPFDGAIVNVTTFDANGAFHGTTTIFGPLGTMTGTFTGQAFPPAPDGTFTVTISGKITGGTGGYKKATGSTTANGKGSTTPGVPGTATITGSVTY